MVMIGRFSSDDPDWREPSSRDSDPMIDVGDWSANDPLCKRRTRRRVPNSSADRPETTRSAPRAPCSRSEAPRPSNEG